MKKAHRELRDFIEGLREPLRYECLAAMHRPIVDLQEDVLFFRGAFAGLRADQAAFDPLLQFVIARAEAGDPLASKVRQEIILRKRQPHLREPVPEAPTDYWSEFFKKNEAAWDDFHRKTAPWLFPADPDVVDHARFERDPKIDLSLNTAILTNLSRFGFRRLARRFQSDVLREPLVIRWDKGTWSISMALFLEMPHRSFFASLGEPFSSGAVFGFTIADKAGPRLMEFCRILATVFPELLRAIEEGMRQQDQWIERHRRGTA